MSILFFDSSALAKRYMPEVGTDWVRQQTDLKAGNEIFIAHITLVELYSAIARHYHDAQIDLTGLQTFRSLLMQHVQSQYFVLTLSSSIITRALSLHETHRLRAYDSIQLASALELNARLAVTGQSLIFVASDTRLLEAVGSEGLITDNPENHS